MRERKRGIYMYNIYKERWIDRVRKLKDSSNSTWDKNARIDFIAFG